MVLELDFTDIITIKKIKKFLKDSYYSEYTQGIEWNKIRTEQNKYYIYAVNEKNDVIWVCNLLEKNIDNQNILYAPRGPVIDYHNEKLLLSFFELIENWMKNKNYQKLVINPCIECDIFNNFPKKYKYNLTERRDYGRLLDSCKLAIMDIDNNSEEKLINKLPSKFRQNTRRSYRKGLIQKISTVVDYEKFYKLYLETSVRHEFVPHNIEYFKKIVSEYQNNLIFIEVWYNDIPLAMSIDITYNDKLIYLYGVSSTDNRNMLGMYNLQWEAIKYCINNKISKYDFGGVFCEENDTNNKDYGLYNFKKGYCYNGFKDIISDITIDFGENIK